MGNFFNLMKNKIFPAIFVVLTVAACGPGLQSSTTEKSAKVITEASETLPEYDSVGVISAVNGLTLTLDHDGASGAGLAPGRDDFAAYADVLAEAPLTPGARVAFKFRKTKAGLELSELKTR